MTSRPATPSRQLRLTIRHQPRTGRYIAAVHPEDVRLWQQISSYELLVRGRPATTPAGPRPMLEVLHPFRLQLKELGIRVIGQTPNPRTDGNLGPGLVITGLEAQARHVADDRHHLNLATASALILRLAQLCVADGVVVVRVREISGARQRSGARTRTPSPRWQHPGRGHRGGR